MLSLILAITLYSMPVTKVTRHDDVQSVGRRRTKYMNSNCIQNLSDVLLYFLAPQNYLTKKLEIARCSNNLDTQLERKILIYCSFVKLSQINWNKTQLVKEIVLWCFNIVHGSFFDKLRISQLGQMWLDVKDASFKYIYWWVRFVHGFEERIHSCKLCVFVTWIIFEMLLFCVLDYL